MSREKNITFLANYLTTFSLADIFGRRWELAESLSNHRPSQAFQLAHQYFSDESLDEVFDLMMQHNKKELSEKLSFYSNHIKSEYQQTQLTALLSQDYSRQFSADFHSYTDKFITSIDLRRIQLLQYCFLHEKYILLGIHEIHMLLQQLYDESDGLKLFPIQLALYAYVIPTELQRDYFDVLLPLSSDFDEDAKATYHQEYMTSHFWRSYIAAMEVRNYIYIYFIIYLIVYFNIPYSIVTARESLLRGNQRISSNPRCPCRF